MIILVMCESSGTVRDAFRAAGHDAYSADLLPSDKGMDDPYHFQGDCFVAYHLVTAMAGKIDMVIAHPPCTYLTVSAAWAFMDANYEKYPHVGYHQNVAVDTLVGAARRDARTDAIQFVEDIMNLPCDRIVIENPVGALSTRSTLGKATQYIQPYDFGEDASKRTGLWLKGVAPLIACSDDRCAGRMVQYKGKTVERWSNQLDSGQNALPPSDKRWKTRSKTYQCVADAMVVNWG